MSIDPSRLGGEIRRRVLRRLSDSQLGTVLVAQAHRRIENGGDSEHKYPDLWINRVPFDGFRKGGQPLRDQGQLMQSLNGATERNGDTVTIRLQTPLMYPVYHQHGFTTKGPNYIPLSAAARRFSRVADAFAAGLKRGTDFLIFRKGVTVPQRKIFNTPTEDVQELHAQIRLVLKG